MIYTPAAIVRLWGQTSGGMYRWARQWLSPDDSDLVVRATLSDLWLHASGAHVTPYGPYYHLYWSMTMMTPRRTSARNRQLSLASKRTIQLPTLFQYNDFVRLYCMLYSGSLLTGILYDQRLAVLHLLEDIQPGRTDPQLVRLLAESHPEGFHMLRRLARSNRYINLATQEQKERIETFRRSSVNASASWYARQYGRVVPLLPERTEDEWGTDTTTSAPFPLIPKASQTSDLDLR